MRGCTSEFMWDERGRDGVTAHGARAAAMLLRAGYTQNPC
jgi:hypothetical protein